MKRNTSRPLTGFARSEQGATSVIIALSLTALLGLAALVVDMGVAYIKTAETQTAADAAVMAAGLMLPVGKDDTARRAAMEQTVREYLVKNGVKAETAAEVTFAQEQDGYYHAVGVNVPATSETGFAKIFGIREVTFTRGAEARTIPCTTLSDAVPLSVQEETLQEIIAQGNISHVVLKYGKNTGEVVNGAFGAVDLDGVKGGGANDYYSWLYGGYQGKLHIGDVLPIESGNMAGPTLAGIRLRYEACTHYRTTGGCTAEHYVAGCPRVMKVPVVVYVSNKEVKLVGFAAFVLEDYHTYAAQGYVIGSYVDMVNIGSADGDVTGTAENFGIYSLTLSK